jgi:hypothetical protein
MQNTRKPSVKEILVALLVHLAAFLILLYLSKHSKIPIGLLASVMGTVFMGYLCVRYYGSINRPKRVGFVGLTISFGVLSVLFAIDHYFMDLRINILHIFVLLCAPMFLSQYLEKKAKQQ